MQELLLWFFPGHAKLEDRDELRRALLTLASCWIAAVISAAIAVLQWAWGTWQGVAAGSLCLLVSAVLPFWVRRSGAWRAAGALLCGFVWCSAFVLAAVTGGQQVAAAYYMVFAPALATLLIGRRTGVWIAVASTTAILAIYLSHIAGWVPPVPIDPEIGIRAALRSALLVNLALGSLVAAYEWLRSRSLLDSAESERRYRALADYGPDLIAELDAAGRILHTSAADSSLTGRIALDAIHREDKDSVRSAIALLERQPSVRLPPARWLVDKHEVHWFEASITRFASGSNQHYLVVARDVSERIIFESRLRQSQKMQAVGQLASGLAHDFNNLLMVVSGYSEVIAERLEGDAHALGALEEIQRAIDQGATLTRRLVALSRPSAIARRRLDLNEVVRDSSRMLRVLLGEAISLEIDLEPAALYVSADAGEIEQILVNLIANARDALSVGGAVLVRTTRRGDRVELVVRDDGNGIDPGVRERIFEPFFTTKSAGHGTGLGLYVVHSIATDLGGEIQVQSELGRGTAFTLDLPAASGGGVDELTDSRPRAAGGTEHILLAEDRTELRGLMREALESAGYRVTAAADGIEALALSANEPIDLVLTDLVMPRMGGGTLIRVLREKHPDLRALLISGYPQSAAPGSLDLDPGDRVLRKPFLMRELRAAVRDVLDGR